MRGCTITVIAGEPERNRQITLSVTVEQKKDKTGKKNEGGIIEKKDAAAVATSTHPYSWQAPKKQVKETANAL